MPLYELIADAFRPIAEASFTEMQVRERNDLQRLDRLAALTRSQHASKALAWIFEKPVFQGAEFVRSAGIPKPTGFWVFFARQECSGF